MQVGIDRRVRKSPLCDRIQKNHGRVFSFPPHSSPHSLTSTPETLDMSSVGAHTDPMSDAPTVRGADEAEEAGAGRKRGGGAKNRVRIGRDQADVPPVRDETGEKVSEMFQGFLEA